MKEIISEVISKINMSKVLHSIMEKGFEKLAVSAVAASFFDILTIFSVFLALFFIDLLTRLMCQAHALWIAMFGREFTSKYGNAYLYIRYINSAHKFKFINSWALRTGFTSKALTYMLLIISARICDIILPVNSVLLSLVSTILAITELLSICENLGECEISVAKEIRDIVKKRKDAVK